MGDDRKLIKRGYSAPSQITLVVLCLAVSVMRKWGCRSIFDYGCLFVIWLSVYNIMLNMTFYCHASLCHSAICVQYHVQNNIFFRTSLSHLAICVQYYAEQILIFFQASEKQKFFLHDSDSLNSLKWWFHGKINCFYVKSILIIVDLWKKHVIQFENDLWLLLIYSSERNFFFLM